MSPIQLKSRLQRASIYISHTRHNSNDTIFDLYCGAQITLYHSTGTVVVRGKIKSYWKWDAVAALEQILPRDTRWNYTMQ